MEAKKANDYKFDISHLNLHYGDFHALKDVNMKIEANKITAFIGPSGCGKSTIFRLVNKLLTPAEGTVLVNGTPIEKQKNYCGYMPQQDLLFPWRTVRENLMLPMEIQGGYSKEQMQKKADDALRSVGLADWGDKTPKELSGGMRQRAALLRTYLSSDGVALLDEPFSALDTLTKTSMRYMMLSDRTNITKE
mgnify:CR=1 FL=1